MAAVFPQAAACQENVTGPIEIPDHVARAPDDRRHAARGARRRRRCARCSSASRRATVRGALRRHHRAVGARARDPHRAALRVPRRRGAPEPAHERGARCGGASPSTSASIGALDPDAIERVHGEIAPEPDDRRRPPRPAVRRWCVARPAAGVAGRCSTSSSRAGAGVGARAPTAPSCGARPSAPTTPTRALRRRRGRDRRGAARPPRDRRHHHRRRRSPRRPRSPPARVRAGLAVLEHERLRAAGPLHARGAADTEWVARRLLARMHSYSRRTRRERRRAGHRAGLHALPAALAARRARHPARGRGRARSPWSSSSRASRPPRWRGSPSCSARRLRRYDPAWLDRLCHDGEVALAAPHAARRATTPTRPPAPPSKATPISVVLRDDLAVAARGARAPAPIPAEPARRRDRRGRRGAARARRVLRGRARRGHQPAARRHRARAVGRRRRAACSPSDGFGAIRARVDGGERTRADAAASRGCCAAPRVAGAGRRALVARAHRDRRATPTSTATSSPRRSPSCCSTAGASCSATSRVHDSLRFPWRDLQWALRRLEDRGLVRGGRFVSGFSGEQYALPAAVEQLTHVRKLAAHRRAGHA